MSLTLLTRTPQAFSSIFIERIDTRIARILISVQLSYLPLLEVPIAKQ